MIFSPPPWWISLAAILPSPKTGTSLLALPTAATLGALGIVYGDIGTSPLYAFRAAIKAASVDAIFGDLVLPLLRRGEIARVDILQSHEHTRDAVPLPLHD